jgi:hypothetical protein
MKKCKSCKMEIDLKATKCPHCQADQRIWFRRHPILTGVFILFVIGIIAGSADRNKNRAYPQTPVISTSTNAEQKDLDSKIAKVKQEIENDITQLKTTGKPKSLPQPSPSSAIIVIDAVTLVTEYDKNKVAAQEKYTGKIIQTTAYVQNISKDILGKYYIITSAKADGFGTKIDCYFDDKSQVLTLENGKKATFKGTMQDMSLGSIYIDNCSSRI